MLDTLLRQIIRDYLQGIMMEPAIDIKELTQGQINRMKKQSQVILKSEVFKHCMRTVAEQTKDILLLKSTSQDEVMVNRGVILGLRALEQALSQWAVVSKNSEEIDIDD